MDFEKLSKILPKHPETWSVEEISQWLEFVELKQLQNTFRNSSIDGSCILLLEEHDLKNDLQITSQIWIKKILNWTKKGLKEYAVYLQNKENQFEQIDNEVVIKGTANDVGKSFKRKSTAVYKSSNNNIGVVQKAEPTILLDKQFSINQLSNISNPQQRLNYQLTNNVNTNINNDLNNGTYFLQENEDEEMHDEIQNNYNDMIHNPFKTQNALAADLGYQPQNNQYIIEDQNCLNSNLQQQSQYYLEDIQTIDTMIDENINGCSNTSSNQEIDNFIQKQQQQPTQPNYNLQQQLLLQYQLQQQQLQQLQLNQQQQQQKNLNFYKEQQKNSNTLPDQIQQQPEKYQQLQSQQNQQINQFDKKQNNQSNEIEQEIEQELIIQPTEGVQTTFYCIKQSGGKIGRHSSNQMVILEESVSRFHADIVFENNQFYIKDIGSTTGTFIKITQNMHLKEGCIIEMGSNQFQVERMIYSPNVSECMLSVIEGPNQGEKISVKLKDSKETYSIGRKQSNQLSIQDDQHLSNAHASIYLCDNKFILEDLSSTNGSWKRLSKEGQQSDLYPLQDQTVFKIGTTSTFLVNLNSQKFQCLKKNETDTNHIQNKQSFSNNECIICCENERDALYYPCRHNTACIKCSLHLDKCPICKINIQEKIKIYKS